MCLCERHQTGWQWQPSDLTCPAASLRQRAAQPHRQTRVPGDGIYLLVVHVASLEELPPPGRLNVTVHIEMKADYGYLSAADWPNLPVCAA